MSDEGKLEVLRIEAKTNGEVAAHLRKFADFIERKEVGVSAWAVTIVNADGTAGSTYDGPAEMALVGALDVTKQRIVERWK